jgi:inorganic pyrophosphatase
MNFDYGYIRGTVGKDKDHVDCYIGPNPEAETVFIVHQNDPTTGEYDEDKVMLGFDSENEARKAYLSQYDRLGFLGEIDAMDIETFKEKAFDPKNKGKKLEG